MGEQKNEVKSDWIVEMFKSKEVGDREKGCWVAVGVRKCRGTNPCYFRVPERLLFLPVNCITTAHIQNLPAGVMFLQERFMWWSLYYKMNNSRKIFKELTYAHSESD
jgi:hypothetical protein